MRSGPFIRSSTIIVLLKIVRVIVSDNNDDDNNNININADLVAQHAQKATVGSFGASPSGTRSFSWLGAGWPAGGGQYAQTPSQSRFLPTKGRL